MEENLTMTLLKEFREYRAETNERLTELEEGRKADRKELLEVLDTMQKSITASIEDLKKDMDAKFEKVFAAQRVNEMEHKMFKEKLDAHEKRLNLYNSRINNLEEWAKNMQDGLFPV